MHCYEAYKDREIAGPDVCGAWHYSWHICIDSSGGGCIGGLQMSEQPEALRLASELLALGHGGTCSLAAAELRRLHEENVGLLNQNTELDKKLAELESEGLEQARIIGMGAERELRLMAQVDELERALGIAGKALRLSIECHRCGRYIADV